MSGTESQTPEFVAITGLSGAGRSAAAAHFEDLGWFVIDNLPPSLISKVAELAMAPGTPIGRVALVVGTGPYQAEVMPALQSLNEGPARLRILFLEASTDQLVRRYESSRRRHPMVETDGLEEAIERERDLLDPVRAAADVVIDTSALNVHQLRERVNEMFGPDSPASGMQITVTSFGFKHGLPRDVDLVFDCRFLPNPHWVDELRPLTGLDEAVSGYVLRQEGSQAFLDQLDSLFALLLPAYVSEGKSYLTIAFGCTGGQHRAVAITEEMTTRLRRQGYDPAVHHRDLPEVSR